MTEDKIQTLHPLGKTNKKIDKDKYNAMKGAILNVLQGSELTHLELFAALEKSLKGKFEGNIAWYAETVKLDLEARKVIKRTGSQPQKYRIK